VLWIFPSAGLVLILSAALFMIRSDFGGPNRWRIVEVLHMLVGLVFCLLGLLDRGSKRIALELGDPQDLSPTVTEATSTDFQIVSLPSAPLYSLIENGMALGIIAIVFAALWLADGLLLARAKRKSATRNSGAEKGSPSPSRSSTPDERTASPALERQTTSCVAAGGGP
jgi:hypothetical protein